MCIYSVTESPSHRVTESPSHRVTELLSHRGRYNHGFGDLSIRDCRQRLVRLIEPESSADHFPPGDVVRMTCGDVHGTVQVRKVRSPAPVHLDVLPVHLGMRAYRGRTAIGVLPTHHDAATVAHQVEGLGDGFGRSRRFDDDVGATPAGQGTHRGDALRVWHLEVNDVRGTHAARELESRGRRANR